MYNLEEQIADWRNELANSESIFPENIDELEDHLRASISRLVEQGLSDEEAFFVAARRIGTSTELSREFLKVNGNLIWFQRLSWMIFGLLLFQILNVIGSIFADIANIMISDLDYWEGSFLFYAISVCFPIIVFLLISNISGKDTETQNRLVLFLQSVIKRPIIALGVLFPIFGLIPFIRLMIHGTSATHTVVFYHSINVYNYAAGLFFWPFFWMLVLIWLNRQRQVKFQ
jgi:hypothetical protein